MKYLKYLFIIFSFFPAQGMQKSLYTIEEIPNSRMTEEPFITIKTADNKELTYRKSILKQSRVFEEFFEEYPESTIIDLTTNSAAKNKSTISNFLLLQLLFNAPQRLSLQEINNTIKSFKKQSTFLPRCSINLNEKGINNFTTLKTLFDVIKNPHAIKTIDTDNLLPLFITAHKLEVPHHIIENAANQIYEKKLNKNANKITQRLLRIYYRSCQTLVDLNINPKIEQQENDYIVLNLSNLALKSLQGIENFANTMREEDRYTIDKIDLSVNKLETVDIPLKTIKKIFPNLKKIHLNNNQLNLINHNMVDESLSIDLRNNFIDFESSNTKLSKKLDFYINYFALSIVSLYLFSGYLCYNVLKGNLEDVEMLWQIWNCTAISLIPAVSLVTPAIVTSEKIDFIKCHNHQQQKESPLITQDEFSLKTHGLKDLTQTQKKSSPPIVSRYSTE